MLHFKQIMPYAYESFIFFTSLLNANSKILTFWPALSLDLFILSNLIGNVIYLESKVNN